MSPRPMTSGEEAVWAAVFARKLKDSEANSPRDLHVPGKDREYAIWHGGIVREAAEHAARAVDALRDEVYSGAIMVGYEATSITSVFATQIVAPTDENPWDSKTTDVTLWVLHSPYPDKTWRGLEKCCTAALDEGTLNLVPYGPPYSRSGHIVSEAPLLFETQGFAEAFAGLHDLQDMVPVPVRLTVPFVRRALDTLKEPS